MPAPISDSVAGMSNPTMQTRPHLECQWDTGRFSIEEVVYPADYRQPRHAHSHHGISLVLAGQLREGVGRIEEDAGSLSVVVKPACAFHSDRFGPHGARLLQIRVRDDAAWQRLPMGRWRWLHTGTGLLRMLSILGQLRKRSGLVEDGVIELLAELGAPEARSRGAAPRWLCVAREILDDLATEGMRVSQLADRVGVHPVSLTRAFRRHYGLSVSAYLRHVRLRKAAAAMTASTALTLVAQQAGYADQAHLCRDMRKLTGLTPSAYRRLTFRV